MRGTATEKGEPRVTAISFTFPLASAPDAVYVTLAQKETPECKGGVEKPEAQEGFLCVFEGETPAHLGGLKFLVFLNAEGVAGGTNAGKTGVQVAFETLKPTKAGEEVSAEGTWAVTAN